MFLFVCLFSLAGLADWLVLEHAHLPAVRALMGAEEKTVLISDMREALVAVLLSLATQKTLVLCCEDVRKSS